MNVLKMALLGGAALAVSAAGAQADDLADLKARIAALEAAQVSAPALPAGVSLMTVKRGAATKVVGLEADKGVGENALVFSVLPTADAAPAATLEVSGYVRAILGYADDGTDGDLDVWARGQINVLGKTDTSVGEVGGKISIRATNFEGGGKENETVRMNEAWGWWQATPDLNFAGGYTGTLGNVGYGVDGSCSCYWTDSAGAFGVFNPGDEEQFRLTWANGPISIAVALEDGRDGIQDTGAAAKIKYEGDAFSGAISGWTADDGDWQASVGGAFSLGDMLALSVAATTGQRGAAGDFWAVSGLATMTLTDAVSFEVGAAHDDNDITSQTAVLSGLYYSPVSELTMGIEGEYQMNNDGIDDAFLASFVTNWKFHE